MADCVVFPAHREDVPEPRSAADSFITGKSATDEEIKFLRNIGTYGPGAPVHVEEVNPNVRLQLLRGYAEGIEKRHRWSSLSQVAVRQELSRLIAIAELQQ